ncbi:FAD/NAD(P)-binding protein [Corynebacterium halotolerans]|uniref:FAD-dependent urate hydroxylase HpyO/Asp monooxygenase CreE-like FAD/NAD(P)-binding domain-containing protein n=1 Tax=Corynebacterium halotolerans YIM 70093 = DSM 44683 TaxID=1121362 RepID=M1P6E9_9CORY|nr:FAD/NAD(P)-binding protein [Corynebacterium halotolerans]AGF72246.1 hypothetical protein A605_06200 [Corynebacterium halotolerans YIM 70093 = DSM 44683]
MPAPLTRLLIVGGGPRAAGILERILANTDLLDGSRLHIDIADPHQPGAGRIWRPDQSGLLLMNSRAEDVSVFTDDSVTCAGPARPGPSLSEWAALVRAGEISLPEGTDDLLPELAGLDGGSFASRRLLSQYLSWFFHETIQTLPGHVTVASHPLLVTSLTEHAGADGDGSPFTARLSDGTVLEADLVVLSLGHTDAAQDARATANRDFARRHGLFYSAPAQSHELDLSGVGAGRDVLVSGMGLAFIDVMAQLGEGRGGVFHPDPRPDQPDRLRYEPSGREPRMWIGSRRGVPYHSKISSQLRGQTGTRLQFITPELINRLPETINFREHILPAITAECEYFVYREILTGHPGWSAMSWEEFEPRFRSAVAAGADRSALIAAAVPDDSLHLDLAAINLPFAGRHFSSPEEVEDALVAYIEEDLHLRTSPEHSETQALFMAILLIHMELARILPVARLDAASRHVFPDRWQSFFSLVDSGPPPHRLHQLLALHRADVLRFLGPGVVVRADEETGRFTATSHQSPVELSAEAYIDAFLPPQVVEGTANPLLAQVTADGLVREERIDAPTGAGHPVGTGRLEVDTDHQLLRPDGSRHTRLWATGPTSSEIPLGAFSRPNTNAAPFRRNDAMARDILNAARDSGDDRVTSLAGRGQGR